MKEEYENLEQYDFLDDAYLEKVEDKYAPLVGIFILKFSVIDHNLNVAISEIINNRAHEVGYHIVEHLTVSNKISLFYRLYLRIVNLTNKTQYPGLKQSDVLKKLNKDLEEINTFRNILVHANWSTINKDSFVRTKILTDKYIGDIKFKNIKITPKIIRDKIKLIKSIDLDINEFYKIALEL